MRLIFYLFSRSKHELDEYRKNKEITLIGKDIPNPIFTFEEAGFPDYVMQEIK